MTRIGPEAGRSVGEFTHILTQRRGQELRDWIARVGTDGARALRSFAPGLERDLDAVTAGLTVPTDPALSMERLIESR